MKLLIVDDSNVIRTRITRILEMGALPSAQVMEASSGAQAVYIAKATQPQIITMDLTMPEMDGVTAIKELMKINPKFNILVVSALADKSTAISALRYGARGFLHKPFTDEQLVRALLDVIAEE